MRSVRLILALLALAAPALAQPTDLFISEYIEGSSNNKAIEIFNGTGGAINLATGQYQLEYYFNGSASAGLTIVLSGTVANGDVWVVAHGSANAGILAQADQTNSSGWFNGDDAIILRKGGAAGTIVDSVGQVGNDPGTEWGSGLTSTADNTLRRKGAVCAGDVVANDSFDPATEWDGFAVDTTAGLGAHSVTCGGPPTVTLNIADVTLAEGDPPGTTTFTFAVTLTAPAGPGGVTFDIATADGTAQDDNPATEDNDYVAQSLTGQSIAAGSTDPYNFNVTVNRDSAVEPHETFFVNVTNIVGANAGDTQGLGTINNDDVTLTPIHDIQGPGASSPIVGASVTTRGIVTGVKSNGFFIQEPDATVDADPATSEGILVFGSPVPAAAVVGALVQVTGTVAEFVPSQDSLQPPLTELTGATVVQLSTGNPLPTPVPLTAAFPDPAGPVDQLERIEGMRASVASLTVTGPTLGNTSEANATETSTGVFYGVVTGVPRPFREAGIQAPDPAPSGGGTIPPIPRFDANPERIRVDSDGLVGGPLIDVGTGAVVTNLIGPVDYSFRTYTILPDPSWSGTAAGGPTPAAVAVPTARELTVASYNLERFFDTVNDPAIGEPVLTAPAFDNRLGKASRQIRNFLRVPDILGVVEVENLSTLQTLAARISTDALAASQPDPQYVAYLVEGNDVGGIDVGFLVKTAEVAASTPRVEVVEVVQELDGTLFTNPDSSTDPLNDRPPLRLNAIVHHPSGASFPVTVIVNHLRSLGSVTSEDPGSNGWSTAGARVRAKRLAQAEDLANLVQARQTADPTERIILVGDFNAFEVNDGLVDSLAVIAGMPVPDNETAVPGDGGDLVNPDLDNLVDTPPAAERYGYVFDGNAQNLDHVLVNQPLITDTLARRLEHPRINADFPAVARNDYSTATGVAALSDHDPVVAFFEVASFATAEVSISKSDGADPVTAGTNLSYTITVANAGPDPAANVEWTDTLPAGTTFVSLTAPGGWTCSTPALGATGNVSCSIDPLAPGSAAFTLTVQVASSVLNGAVLSNTATVTSTTTDPTPGNESATATTTVTNTGFVAAVSGTKTASGTFREGSTVTYTVVLSNAGPGTQQDNPGDEFTDVLPAGLALVSASATSGTAVTNVATNTVTWNGSIPAAGSVTVTIQGTITAAVGVSIVNQGAFVFDGDGNGTNETPGVTDDPAGAGAGDPTVFAVAAAMTEIPTLDGLGLAALGLGLAALGARRLRRRR